MTDDRKRNTGGEVECKCGLRGHFSAFSSHANCPLRPVAAEARAERLADALDHIARVGMGSRKQTKRTRWIVARAVSAVNGDETWIEIPKPHGYHDALDRPAALSLEPNP